MKLLNYYLSTGMIKKNNVDFSQLPSKILNNLDQQKSQKFV